MLLRRTAASRPGVMDWLRVPVLGRFLRWRHSRKVMQLPLFVLAIAMIVHGFAGPELAPRNLSTLLTWVHYRGALVLVLLASGNLFCMACPLMLPRELARRFFKPVLRWPRRLRTKWVAAGLFAAILFAYERFDLWDSPWWTAWLMAGYFAAALAVDALFKDASFCKWVCPIGQFSFVASTVSPLEVRVRDTDVCAHCETYDCIRGTRAPDDRSQVIQRGCELHLFQPRKTGNLDCTFCLDCVYACPHDNVGILSRVPASELWSDRRRSGVGLLSKRKDLAALALVFTFGAILNA
ncbi:MAG TPA: FesM, partial [Thermoanaerobaculia bacterium]|nr:FesM [Thermoanaerobaculia bacterium]